MDLTRTAYGTWNGGRFMHFGEPLDDARFASVIRLAYDEGVRTFVTADVYGSGQADQMLGAALKGLPRESYRLVGAVGHDFYLGKREGAKGFPRFTNATLRNEDDYAAYLRMATEKSLERCGVSRFDLLMLHNPDAIGYSSDAVWKGMELLKTAGLTDQLGIAPGPANGFTLDLISSFETFEGLIDWAMIILNPLEPWPGHFVLPAAQKHGIKLITRVVDYGGLFHDDVRPGHQFGAQDHRTFRPQGWVEAGVKRMEPMRAIAARHNLTMLQFSCLWNLSQAPVRSVVPTLIQEHGTDTKPIEQKVRELATLPELKLSADEVEEVRRIGDNKGCMHLKGGNGSNAGDILADAWPLTPQLEEVGRRWSIDPTRDLSFNHG